MQFQYYRFFLSPIDGNLFSQIPNSKANALKYIFENDYEEFYKGSNYSICKEKTVDDMLLYRIAKHTSVQINHQKNILNVNMLTIGLIYQWLSV